MQNAFYIDGKKWNTFLWNKITENVIIHIKWVRCLSEKTILILPIFSRTIITASSARRIDPYKIIGITDKTSIYELAYFWRNTSLLVKQKRLAYWVAPLQNKPVNVTLVAISEIVEICDGNRLSPDSLISWFHSIKPGKFFLLSCSFDHLKK